MSRSILFDFDGTLNDTWRLYLESFRRALEPHYGVLSDDQIIEYGPSAERRFLQRMIAEHHYPECYDSFMSHYCALHDAMNDGLYAGVSEMLAELRRTGHRVGIVTGKSRKAWETTYAKSGLEPFDVVITDDDVAHPKPDPEGLLKALEMLNGRSAEALYVGDSLLDYRAARTARIAFGAALWSKQPDERAAFAAAVGEQGGAALFAQPSDVVPHVLHVLPHHR